MDTRVGVASQPTINTEARVRPSWQEQLQETQPPALRAEQPAPAESTQSPLDAYEPAADTRDALPTRAQLLAHVFGPTGSGASPSVDKMAYASQFQDYRDASTEPPTVDSKEALANKVRAGQDFADRPQMGRMVKLLERENMADPKRLTYLEQISRRLGPRRSERIFQTLNDYMVRQGSRDEVRRLASDALHDVAIPSNIDQGPKGTCSMTGLQMKWAIDKPETYVQALTSLAERGRWGMPGGGILERNDSWKKEPDDPRSLSVKMISDSLMAAGSSLFAGHIGYDAAKDSNGRTPFELADMMRRVTGDDSYGYNTRYSPFHGGESMYGWVEDDIARGRVAMVGFGNMTGGHFVPVVGIDKTSTPHRVIINTWGSQKSMTVDEFKRYVRDVETRDDSGWDSRKVPDGQRIILGDRP